MEKSFITSGPDLLPKLLVIECKKKTDLIRFDIEGKGLNRLG